MIISRTPLRISLVGGGTDVPSFYEKSPGAVISFAINKYVYIAVNEKFDNHFRVSYSITENVDTVEEIKHDLVRNTLKHFKVKSGMEIVSVADVPGSGTGLGSSSAFEVGLINALQFDGDAFSRGVLAESAFMIERECHPFIGKQDAYASAYGGFNFIRFNRGNVEVKPLTMERQSQDEIESWFLLLYTGITRPSDELLREQSKAFDGDKLAIGKDMVVLAEEFYKQYQEGHIDIGALLHANWTMKMRLYDGVSNHQINYWYTQGIANGALGGKLCGAGGGGFLLFFAPPDAHAKIAEVTGLRRLDFKIEMEGSKIIYG